MTIVLDLTPEQETRLREKAALAGQEVGPYLIARALQEPEQDEWLRLLYSIGVETGVSLSDEAVRVYIRTICNGLPGGYQCSHAPCQCQ